ncbi:MAG: molybdopterin-dependent oxidoreductase [Planctomycetota bacterium]|nr:molybdopterin-dependent oxidoreductase [Planctomycetota bacterium]
MAESHQREFPAGTKRITTGCQYCAVGCGYNAFLVPEPSEGSTPVTLDGVARFITPAMRGEVNFRGKRHLAAVAPDVRCDLNKGNHSVRGGSQGHNLVSHDGSGRSTQARLKSPHVRLTDGNLHEITWAQLNQILAKLIVAATQMSATPATAGDRKVKVDRPQGLGVKICEYQYLENAYAATKLFYSAIGTPNVAYHDRPSAAGSSPGLQDVGLGPHNFSYGEVNRSDVLLFVGTNPYENQSVFFMQYCAGHEMIVIDPRRTATAQYALETGGLHLQPTALGADSLVMYAICRELLLRWRTSHGTLDSFPWRDRVLADLGQLPTDDDDAQQRAEKRRRASRTATFDGFAKFLGVDDAESRYALSNAADVSGIPLADLHDAVDRLLKLNAARDEQPKVGIFYEKGMIWGFNYHNTASVGSLGLLLGAYSEPGRFVGRVGGHQKGWAASRMDLSGHFISSNTSDPTGYSQGFPFRNATDEFTDVALQAKFGVNASIQVHHNLDNHLFGPSPTDVLSSVGDRVTLRNGLTTNADPDVRLLWIIGGNYLGQTNDSGRKVDALNTRLRCGRNYGVIERSTSTDVNEIVGVLQQRVESPNGIVLIHQDVFENPTTEFCDLVIPAAGWGEDTFCRYNAQRRLKLYERFQDMPIHAEDRQRVDGHDPLDHCRFDHPDRLMKSPQPDWVIFRDVAHAIGQEIDSQSTDTDFQQRMRDVFD